MVRTRSTGVKGRRQPDEDSNVLFEAWRLSRAVSALLDGVLAPSGLTADEFGVYSVLAGVASITPTELARWMAAPPTTVSSYVKRFEGRGHVQRATNPEDLRSYRIQLTQAGRRVHRRAAELFAPTLARVLSTLDDREADVRTAVQVLRESAEAVRGVEPFGPQSPS
jgi:DNA-binding MarR family transcriptional regulator